MQITITVQLMTKRKVNGISIQEERSYACHGIPFENKDFRAITSKHCNSNLRKNTNHVFSIFNKTKFEPKYSQDWNINPIHFVKKAVMIGTLAKKLNLRIAVHNNSGRKKERIKWRWKWMDWDLERSVITYTTPRRKDTVYVGMGSGESEYQQKWYLLWKLFDLLEIINGSKIITNENFSSFTEAFENDLSFLQMYNFLKMHKEVAYNSDISHSSCLCEVRENASLLANGMNSSLKSSDTLLPTAHDLLKTDKGDSSLKNCMLGNCLECLKPLSQEKKTP